MDVIVAARASVKGQPCKPSTWMAECLSHLPGLWGSSQLSIFACTPARMTLLPFGFGWSLHGWSTDPPHPLFAKGEMARRLYRYFCFDSRI